jgi:hypothetical protein
MQAEVIVVTMMSMEAHSEISTNAKKNMQALRIESEHTFL